MPPNLKKERVKKEKKMDTIHDRRMIMYIEEAKTCTDVNNYFKSKQDESDSSFLNTVVKFFFKHHPNYKT